MAINFKSDGKVFDANLIIQTGVTITAGSLIWADVSGTDVVHPVRFYSGASPETNATLPLSGTGRGIASMDTNLVSSGVFLGVIENTQTGTPNGPATSNGSQTGVTFFTEGVFEFNTTPTASAALRIGAPVWALNWDTVACLLSGVSLPDATGTNSTGSNPIGVVSFFPRGPVATNTVASRVRVKILPWKTIQAG